MTPKGREVEEKMNKLHTRRTLVGALALGALAPAWSQSPAARKTGAPPWRLVINEAVTGETNFFLLTSRYRPWADFMTAQLKGRPIGIEPVVDIKRFMTVAQGRTKPELVFGKSVNQLAKLVRDNGYQPVVRRADPYKAAFIVAKDSPIKTLADAANARIVMPDEYAATTAVARAELRRQNIAIGEILHVRFQESVAQQIKSGMGQVGVVNPTVARKWADEGGRVIAETQPVVNWSVLASPRLHSDAVHHLQDALLGMNTREPAILVALGVKEWARAERKEFLALLDYTKE
jgi:ABC-type phosphate/phosphonate transport system substrate-binding protein